MRILLDKKRICYLFRSHYPEYFGIRYLFQTMKLKRLYRHTLTTEEIEICEKNPSKKEKIITPYLSKWRKYLLPSIVEMEDILTNGPLYKDRMDKRDIKVDMIFCRLAYGFIPSEYVCFELEKKSPYERKEYVSDIDMDVFGYSVNDISAIQTVLDKGDCFYRFKKYYKRDAIVINKSEDYEAFHFFIEKNPVFVKKASFSSMGKGIEVVDISLIQDKKRYFDELIKSGKYLLEEIVNQKQEMSVFNRSSVNTVRCITLKTRKGIIVPWCFMRAGRNGSFVDNGGSGGLVIGVDPNTGVINTDGYDEYNDKYDVHPDSKTKFKGKQIPEWDELISLCKSAHGEVEKMGYLSWDMAYTDAGWIVIEINEVGQFIGPQMTMKKGIKKELWEYKSMMKHYGNV